MGHGLGGGDPRELARGGPHHRIVKQVPDLLCENVWDYVGREQAAQRLVGHGDVLSCPHVGQDCPQYSNHCT